MILLTWMSFIFSINMGVFLFLVRQRFYPRQLFGQALLLIADQAVFAGAAAYFCPHFLAWFGRPSAHE